MLRRDRASSSSARRILYALVGCGAALLVLLVLVALSHLRSAHGGRSASATLKSLDSAYMSAREQYFLHHRDDEVRSDDFLFDLDAPRRDDERAFFHAKTRGSTVAAAADVSIDAELEKLGEKADDAEEGPEKTFAQRWLLPSSFVPDITLETAHHLHRYFAMFDDSNKNADSSSSASEASSIEVYGTMCIGVDCGFIPIMISKLNIPIGHFLVVVSTDEMRWVLFFKRLQALFPGRFTAFVRPERLSCAESWNLVTRIGFAGIRPMPAQIFIANADWHPIASDRVENNMAEYARWSRPQTQSVVAMLYHRFSAFSFTAFGYRELGYFDEVLFPALTEDVEFHIKATSKGLGRLPAFPNGDAGSYHIPRQSVGNPKSKLNKRYGRTARFLYIWQKWNVSMPRDFGTSTDFTTARPWRHPWNTAQIRHNNSWVVDSAHRRCAVTGAGRKFINEPERCVFDPQVLKKLLPAGEELMLPVRMLTAQGAEIDPFMGGSFL